MVDINNASVFSQAVPHILYEDLTGQKATIVMENTGNTDWGVAGDPNPFYLRSLNPPGNDIWGVVQMPVTQLAGITQTATFVIPLDNVSLPPRHLYNFQWQMYREGVGYFGQPTSNVQINVEISGK